MLLTKVPAEYKPAFRREGVFHEIEALAGRTLSSSKSKEKEKDKDKDKETPDVIPSEVINAGYPNVASLAFVPGYKKISSLAVDPDDAITIRARVIKFKYLSSDDTDASDSLSASLARLVAQLANKDTQEKDLMPPLVELASLFASAHTSVSSFELLQSGVVDGLLEFISSDTARPSECCIISITIVTESARAVSINRRRDMFFEAFTTRKVKGNKSGETPLAIFVKKLQESLTRMESFEVVTVAQSADGTIHLSALHPLG